MNKIEAYIDKGDYDIYPDFLNIRIDNIWLDEFLDNLEPDKEIKSTIPTLSFGLERDSEKEVVWERFLPKEGDTTYCPILMCPDDCDFYCICIIAEIQNTGQTIIWSKMGADGSDVRDASNVGTIVDWYPNFRKLEFNIQDYFKVFTDFKDRYEADKIDYQIRSEKFAEEQKSKTNK